MKKIQGYKELLAWQRAKDLVHLSMKLPALVLPLLLATCSFLPFSAALADEPTKPTEKLKKSSDWVAKVNNVPITINLLDQAMGERIPATGHATLSEKRLLEIRQEELDKLIIEEVLIQEVRRLGIKATAEEVELELSKIKARFPSEKRFKEALDRRGLTLSSVREGLERHLLIQKVIDQEVHSKITLTDDQLKEYYEGHREQFQLPEQIRLRLILVTVDPSGLPSDWEEGRKKAQGLADRARAGEDFVSLVAQFSDLEDEPTRERGGDTGLVHRGRLPFKELESVAFSHKVGQVSDPIRTLYGYVVFKVEEKYPSKQLGYDEVNKELLRSEMMSSAAQRRWEEWIKGLKAKADITIY